MKFGTATSLAVAILSILVLKSSAQDCELDAVCYALDQSGSVDDNEYEQITNFTITSARLFPKGSLTSYSAVAFSSSNQTIQAPTKDLEGVFVPSVRSPRIFKGGTNIYSGLNACYNILRGNSSPGKVLVLVTDGHGHDGGSPVDMIKAEKINIVSIGVGSGVNQQFLLQLASSPSFYLPTSAFNLLPTFAQRVSSAVCAAVSSPSATATTTPSSTASTSMTSTPSASTSTSATSSASMTSTPSASTSASATSSASMSASPSATSSTTPTPSVSMSSSPTASSSMIPSSSASMMPSSSSSMMPSSSASVSPVPSSSSSPSFVPEESEMVEMPSMEPSPEEITPSNLVQTMDVLPTQTPTSSPTSPFFFALSQAKQTCQDSCMNAIEECRTMIQTACK